MCSLQMFAARVQQVSRRSCASVRHRSYSKGSCRRGCRILVVGGGCAGCAIGAKLCSRLGTGRVIMLEPAEKHYYQPMFTMIGSGLKRLEQSFRPMRDVLPKQATWIKEKAVYFEPKCNFVVTSAGCKITYDILIIAAGLQLNYDKIPGLIRALTINNGKVGSIFSPKYVNRVFKTMQSIEEGNAIFTYPATLLKCPGAPQKIMYMSEHFFRRTNKRDKINIIYNSSLPVLFACKYYADALWKIVKARNIKVNLRRNLIEVCPKHDIAIFQNLDNPDEIFEERYSMLHVTPPMSPPDVVTQCNELVNEAGFVDVNKSTMQHVRFRNIFAIGDCSGSPNSKGAAAAAAQSPVVFQNILAVLYGRELKASYNGYTSCPLMTGYNRVMLVEFDYSFEPLETLPIAQNKESYLMYLVKDIVLPPIYWYMMLRGYWNGPGFMRDFMSIFASSEKKLRMGKGRAKQ